MSSIKRIIAEEGDAAVGQSSRPRKSARAAAEAVRPDPQPRDDYDSEDDGVLDLDGFPAPPPPTHEALRSAPAIDPDHEEPVSMTRPRSVDAETAPKAAPVDRESADTILSDRAAQASSRSLDSLSKLVVRPEVAGSDTLEGLVREMLRPMLREWLDDNLPSMVENMVAREISRITNSRG